MSLKRKMEKFKHKDTFGLSKPGLTYVYQQREFKILLLQCVHVLLCFVNDSKAIEYLLQEVFSKQDSSAIMISVDLCIYFLL